MYRYRFCFSKEKEMKYISHLDLQRTFMRALRRASVPVAYTQGFNPQPRLVFAAPLAVGIEGKNEYFDLFLVRRWDENVLKRVLQEQLPVGLEVKATLPVDPLAVVPGNGFGAPEYARFSYATSMENISKGLDRLENFLRELT
jgi:radical SAM-linked protein